MPVAAIFQVQMCLGYAAWLAWLLSYGWPHTKKMTHEAVHRAIAALHSFRFFGLAFIIPGVVGSNLPEGFGTSPLMAIWRQDCLPWQHS